jgi:hypothetical protein
MGAKKLKWDDIDFILECLAGNRTAKDAVKELKNNHGVEITVRYAYDLQKKYFEQYEYKRERKLKEFGDTPLAYAKYRIIDTQKIAEHAEKTGDYELWLSALNTAQRIAEPLGLEAQGRGATKEVEDFLASVAFGQTDNREVSRNP